MGLQRLLMETVMADTAMVINVSVTTRLYGSRLSSAC